MPRQAARTSPFQVAQGAPLPTDVFRVYEATDPFHPRPYRLALRRSREAVLQADMDCGRKLMRLGRLVLETGEEAQARRLAQALYL